MKLTHFFIFLFLFSIALFVFLKPKDYAKSADENVAQLEIENFTLYEMDKTGVLSVVSGSLGRQYVKHYEVQNMHYIENKNQIGEHLYSDYGVFKYDIAYLNDNVRYFKEDGLSFESDYAIYNTKKLTLFVPEKFVLTEGKDVIYGSDLLYNSTSGQMSANKIEANYNIEEKK